MSKTAWKAELGVQRTFFHNSLRGLTESDAGFAPSAGMFTVAQQIAHVAQTIDWFLDGAFSPEGMSEDFAEHIKEVQSVTTMASALSWLDKSYDRAIEAVDKHDEAAWHEPIAGTILGGQPRHAIVGSICDHTAHHRGALTVYIRMRGMEPKMPYM